MAQGFGKRADGSEKGNGFLGAIQRPDGKVSSEISVGVNIDGKEVDIPTLVPTLTKAERDFLINNDISDPKKIPASIIQKAVDHARPRLAAGKSPFAGPEDTMADPKLEEIVQRMVDAGESEENIGAVISEYKPAAAEKPYTGGPVDGGPEDFWSGFLTSLKPGGSSDQAALKGAKGFAKEIVPGVGKAVLAMPGQVIDLVKELVATGIGGVNLATDPVGTLAAASEKVKAMPEAVQKAFQSAVELAGKDPEAFGRGVADITAQAGVGVATTRAVPMMPKPIAQRIGNVMEQVGTKGAWPIRMMGAHQLGSGNPMGLLTMSAPEAFKSAGDKMLKFAGVDRVKTLPSGARELDLGDVKSPAIRVLSSSGKVQNGPHVATVGNTVEPSAGAIRTRAKADAVIDQQQAQLLKDFQTKKVNDKATRIIEEAKAGMEPGPKKITETVKAPGQTMSTTYAEEGSGFTPMEKEMLKRASSVKPVASHRSVDSLAPKVEPIKTMEQRGPSLNIRGLGDEPIPETALTPASRSSRAQSPISGMSVEDVGAMQDILQKNPGISPNEAAAEVVKQRAQRSSMYRNDARLSKLEQSALDREK